MLIHVAQNGKKFELDCQASTSVDVVQKALATLMGVPPAEQMLICRDLRLEPSRTLGHYGLPAEDKHVFLFNRSSLVADAPIPEADLVDDVELELPGEPSRLEIGHPLDESPNPLLRALPSYERQFRYHYQKAQAIWRGSQQRYDLCRQLFAEMEVQAMAIQTARGNMDIYYSHMKQRYDEFTRSCQEQHRKHSDILGNFERDMDRLRNTELHPVLKTESRSTLLDCLNDQGIRKWADDCATSHTHFEAKVGELRAQFTGLQRNVEDLKMTEPDVDLEHIEDQMEEHQAAVDEQASILQSLSKDLNTVKKLVEDCVSGQLTSSLRPLDAVAALDPMSEVHINNHLPTVEHCDARLSELVQHMNKCKVAMTRCVHTQLQSVAALQRRIRDMRNQLVGYREAMQRQEEVFAELLLVRKVASSYRACLAEVVRRKAYAELYTRKAGQLAERMARDRDAEVARREEFMRQQGLLPREILEGMGLSGVPSQCEVNVPTFDSSLLDIDVADLQNLAQIGGVPEERPKSRLGGGSRQLSASMSGSGAMVTSTMVGSQKAGAFEGGGDISIMTGVERRDTSAEGGVAGGGYDMEVENAWLRSEYAAAVAMLCTLEEEEEVGGEESAEGPPPRRREAAQRVSEALRRKDEHAQFLQESLARQKQQLDAYEQRIREVESQLAEQHKKSQQVSGGASGTGEGGSVVTVEKGGKMGGEEVTSTGKSTPPERVEEARPVGLDQTMVDVTLGETRMLESGMGSVVRDMEEGGVSALQEGGRAGRQVEEAGGKMTEPKDGADTARHKASEADAAHDVTLRRELHQVQEALVHRTAACVDAEGRVQALTAEVADLNTQLKRNADLLSECQVNCAHLENHLHEARETAQTNLVTAERRGKEYDSLRAKSVRMHGLLDRLNRCLAAPSDAFPEALSNLAASLSNGGLGRAEDEEVFVGSVRQLAEQVNQLVQQRAELLARIQHAEDAKSRLVKQVEVASEKLRSLAVKHERAVQISKEKICFTSFNVHELAVFLPNAVGHYEAVNCNCPYYFLAEESVLLFRHHQPESAHKYIVGQIVHIDHNVTRPPSPESMAGGLIEGKNEGGGRGPRWNPFGLPLGTDYFVVTVAMVPDLTTSLQRATSS